MSDNIKRKRALSPRQQRERYIKQVKRKNRVLQRNNGRHVRDALNNRAELDKLSYVVLDKSDWIETYGPLMSSKSDSLLIFDGGEKSLSRAEDNKIWSVVYIGDGQLVVRSGYHPGRHNKGYVVCKKGHEYKGIEVKL